MKRIGGDIMSEHVFASKLAEYKVLLVMLMFGFVSGLRNVTNMYLPAYLETVGLSIIETGVLLQYVSYVMFIINPVILFVLLYFKYTGNLMKKTASTIISLILGSVIGSWLGRISGALLVALSSLEVSFAEGLYSSPIEATWGPVNLSIIGFTAVAAAEINKKWRGSLLKPDLQPERPFGVTVLSFLYVIFGILTTCLIPIFILYPAFIEIIHRPLLGIGLISLLIISGFIQVLIGACLYLGRKWGWIPAFIFSVVSVLNSVNILLSFELWSYSLLLSAVITGLAVTSLVISVIVTVYLLQFNVRRYFGFVNPISSPEPPSPKS